ncbi:endo alpha-1,4 polygalactosaminidase [Amnibacterium endophyticum]|uniref:Endo alpha-1,4 polygalactosaminidase n=1 Tax=Amnibacterium endophyticum TaxID=2109337 RepID=A0ABW4L9G4_9MICO
MGTLRRLPRRRSPRLPLAAAILAAAGVVIVALLALAAQQSAGGSRTAPPWRLPPANSGFDYQIGGPYSPQPRAAVVVRDRDTKPAPRHYNVCYVNAFETQVVDEGFWMRRHPDLLLRIDGSPVEDPNWPGQYLLDTSTAEHRAALVKIVSAWIRGCAAKGFDAVEFDNLDSWYRSNDRISVADNLALARSLVDVAHDHRLAAAQKNGAVLKDEGRETAGFDFAITESCEVFDECDSYTDAYGARVFEIEYTDESGDPFPRACAARGGRISIILRDRLVVPEGKPDYRYDAC